MISTILSFTSGVVHCDSLVQWFIVVHCGRCYMGDMMSTTVPTVD